jgi:hypothetical protein
MAVAQKVDGHMTVVLSISVVRVTDDGRVVLAFGDDRKETAPMRAGDRSDVHYTIDLHLP